ncbi:hypothetical protein H6G80_30285 [Nostoc sp. FACHB-87]|uniref:hypothetical protein n=1 Tax=Nostocaceae TaxID=1162 RepID=UPI001684FDB4|nr:hypothetical protein [Nostoc sp. FACHB-87]MBD2479346.1 hypothetical protein [Anabaena sp. FACHB-83]
MNHRQYQAEYFVDHKYLIIRCRRIRPLAKFLHQTAIASLVSACFLGESDRGLC